MLKQLCDYSLYSDKFTEFKDVIFLVTNVNKHEKIVCSSVNNVRDVGMLEMCPCVKFRSRFALVIVSLVAIWCVKNRKEIDKSYQISQQEKCTLD